MRGSPITDDPFAWLEDSTSAADEWQREQDGKARAALSEWTHQPAVRELVRRLTPAAGAASPRLIGEHVVIVSDSMMGPGPLIRVVSPGSDPAATDGQVLFDAGRLAEAQGTPLALDFLVGAPDGRHAIVGVSRPGSEQSSLHVVDVDGVDGAVTYPHAARTTVAWMPDHRGLYFGAGSGPETQTMQRCLVRHDFGSGTFVTEDVDLRGRTWVTPQVGTTHAAVLVHEGNFLPRPWYVRPHASKAGGWTPFLRDIDGMVHGSFVDDEYVAVHISGSGNGRVVAIPLDGGADQATWRVLLDESELALVGCRDLGGDRLLVAGLIDGDSAAVLLTLHGGVVARIAPAGPGATAFPVPIHATALPGSSRSDALPPSVAFSHSSATSSPATYSISTETGAVAELAAPAIDLPDVVCERRRVVADDGVAVPIDVIRRADIDPSRPAPTLIYGYGGFNVPVHRAYDPLYAAFVASGGVLVLAQLRGGGDLGWQWWHSGRFAHKQRTFDDLYAIAEDLIARGETTATQLGVFGMSCGGLLAAVAVTQRPDLWGAVASLVPVCDLLRIDRDPWGWFRSAPEFGDPAVPEHAEWMRAYSPYENVRPGTPYPPTLVVTADADSRTYPWHGRKFVAALQDAASDADAIQLVNIAGGGHFAAMDPAHQPLWLGFLMRHLGVTPAA